MSDSLESGAAKRTLHPEFVKNMVRTFDDPDEHGVHMLFNEWWPHAPDDTIERYLEGFRETPGAKTFLEERYFSEPIELETLAAMPEGSLGRGYHAFLTDNGLEKNLATNYEMLHDYMAKSGQLDRMPDDMKFAIIRGWQRGRAIENLQFEKWEAMLEEPLAELRPRYGIAPEGF